MDCNIDGETWGKYETCIGLQNREQYNQEMINEREGERGGGSGQGKNWS